MAEPTQAQAQTVKQITDNIERSYRAMRATAANLHGLISLGKATCEDIKAYNLWALSVYKMQLSLVATLRAAGEVNVPSIPYPTYFEYKGIAGKDAASINCNAASGSLHGALAAAMAPHSPATAFVSANEVRTVVNANPGNLSTVPSYPEMIQRTGLGFPWVILIIIAASSVAIYVGIPALMAYLTENKIQTETTARNAQLLEGYAAQTKNRLDCFAQCAGKGNDDACLATCVRLAGTPPELATGGQRAATGLTFFSTAGLVGVVALGSYLAFGYFQRRRDHEPRLASE